MEKVLNAKSALVDLGPKLFPSTNSGVQKIHSAPKLEVTRPLWGEHPTAPAPTPPRGRTTPHRGTNLQRRTLARVRFFKIQIRNDSVNSDPFDDQWWVLSWRAQLGSHASLPSWRNNTCLPIKHSFTVSDKQFFRPLGGGEGPPPHLPSPARDLPLGRFPPQIGLP